MAPVVRFDRYYTYAELVSLLHEYASHHADLVGVRSIGRSHEGRELLIVEVTNRSTGDAADKPALWVDGNLHAAELAPSTACLHLLAVLVDGHGVDPLVTHLLDTRTVYVCPRGSPDGAEWALATPPRHVRSSTRVYPDNPGRSRGLEPRDIDGDGRILTMRVEDPNGAWCVHPDEPRLLIRRAPDAIGGRSYRLLPEGTLPEGTPAEGDVATITVATSPHGLDFNRNFPANWRPERLQAGAGPYPTSEPEVRAIVAFLTSHPNVCIAVSLHTFGGMLLRPRSHAADASLPPEDLWTFEAMGREGEARTGYAAASLFHGFRPHAQAVTSGGFDWTYEHLGLVSWLVEMWNPLREAGIDAPSFIDWFREHPVEDDVRLLRWSDERLAGAAHVDWYRHEHPRLGEVELGGWDFLNAFRNPPGAYLEQECRRLPGWLTWLLATTPCLRLRDASCEPLGGATHRLRLVVENVGWLPTNVTAMALEQGAVRGLSARLEASEGVLLLGGDAEIEAGQLHERSSTPASPFLADLSTRDRAAFEWVVRAPEGGRVTVTVRHDRAGTVRHTFDLAAPGLGGEA